MTPDSQPSQQRTVPARLAKILFRLVLFSLVGLLLSSCANPGIPSGVYKSGGSHWLFRPNGAASYVCPYFSVPPMMGSTPVKGEGKWRRDGNEIVITGRFTVPLDGPDWKPWKYEERTLRLTIAENGDLLGPAGMRMERSGRFVRDPYLSKRPRRALWKMPDFKPQTQ